MHVWTENKFMKAGDKETLGGRYVHHKCLKYLQFRPTICSSYVLDTGWYLKCLVPASPTQTSKYGLRSAWRSYAKSCFMHIHVKPRLFAYRLFYTVFWATVTALCIHVTRLQKGVICRPQASRGWNKNICH